MMKNNFQIRVMTGTLMVLIVLPLMYTPTPIFGCAILCGIFISLVEFFNVGRTKFQLKRSYFILPVLLVFSQFITAYFSHSYFLLLFCLAFASLCIWCVIDRTMEIPTFFYLAFVMVYTSLTYEALYFIQMKSLHYLLFLFFAVFATDTGAYFIGKQFGKHKLAVHLSPKKTIEGAIGGLVIGSLSATIFIFLVSIIPAISLGVKPSSLFFFIACVLSISSEFGDLFASKVKRYLEQKDFGFIFPGHGGIIDRVDGLVLASIVFYIILHFI